MQNKNKIVAANSTPVKGVKPAAKRGGVGSAIILLISTFVLLAAMGGVVYYLISFPTALDFYFQRVAQSGYNVPFVAVGAALALILVSRLPVSVAMAMSDSGFNNYNPRRQQDQLSGWGARAVNAHYNAIENFPIFSVAIILATIAGVPSILVTKLSIIFIAARIVYNFLYLFNLALLRSMVFFIGFTSCCFLIFYAATANQVLTKNIE